jgi:hypothetical protein
VEKLKLAAGVLWWACGLLPNGAESVSHGCDCCEYSLNRTGVHGHAVGIDLSISYGFCDERVESGGG